MTTDITKVDNNLPATTQGIGRGFEGVDLTKVSMPRIKVMQGLSPELEDEDYNFKQGDIIHGLLMEKMPENFVPIKFFATRIKFGPRAEGGAIECRSHDGRISHDGLILCAQCPYSKWDESTNTPPECTLTINVLALFEGHEMPVAIPFANTNYKYGKKFMDMALFSGGGDAWNRKYKITSKREKNEKGSYFTTPIKPAGMSSPEERALAALMYRQFAGAAIEVQSADDRAEVPEDDVRF